MKKLKILVVEDDFISRKILLKFLSGFGDCDVAVTGLEALDAYKESVKAANRYDLIFLDIMMPSMDGRRALKEIRKFESDSEVHGLDGVKVIMVSSLNDKQNVLGSFREGAEGYLTKPFTVEDIAVQLRKLGCID